MLHTLYAKGAQLVDLSPLITTHLHILDVALSPGVRLDGLRGLHLTRLNCAACGVEGLESLHGMPLQSLSVPENELVDLAPIAGPALRKLFCGRNRITDLEPLRGLGLISLFCEHNRIVSLDPVRGMRLQYLRAEHNPLRDCAGLLPNPPMTMLLTANAMSDQAIGEAIGIWTAGGHHDHARLLSTMLALRHGATAEQLRALALPVGDRLLLLDPRRVDADGAADLCRALGAELATIERDALDWRSLILGHVPWVGPAPQEDQPLAYFLHGNTRRLGDRNDRRAVLLSWPRPG